MLYSATPDEPDSSTHHRYHDSQHWQQQQPEQPYIYHSPVALQHAADVYYPTPSAALPAYSQYNVSPHHSASYEMPHPYAASPQRPPGQMSARQRRQMEDAIVEEFLQSQNHPAARSPRPLSTPISSSSSSSSGAVQSMGTGAAMTVIANPMLMQHQQHQQQQQQQRPAARALPEDLPSTPQRKVLVLTMILTICTTGLGTSRTHMRCIKFT
jgi:hypothetical protein